MRGLALALAALAACGGDDGGLTPDAGLDPIERFQGGWNLTWTCPTTCAERPDLVVGNVLTVSGTSLIFRTQSLQAAMGGDGCLSVPEAMDGARRRLAFAVCPVGDGLEASIAWTRTDSPTSVDGAWVMRATR